MTSKNQKSKIKNQKDKKVDVKLQSSSEPQTMEELLTQTGYLFTPHKKGDKVTGTIISLSPNEVLIDIGAKSYAQVGHRELENIRDLIDSFKIGDQITGTVV